MSQNKRQKNAKNGMQSSKGEKGSLRRDSQISRNESAVQNESFEILKDNNNF